VADLVLTDAKAYVKDAMVECSIAVDEGRILKIGRETNMPTSDEKMRLKGLLVLPGLVDVHVHLRDEGKSYKEDFFSGTAAAAAGGVTTVLDMPNNEPVTMSAEALRNRMRIAESRVIVNVGFYSEFPSKTSEIGEIRRIGAIAFKLFMGQQIGGLDINSDGSLKEAFESAAKLKIPVAVHAEDNGMVRKAEEELKHAGHNDLAAFLKAHSERVEAKAVERALGIAKLARAKLHVCHVSTGDSVRSIAEAKKSGLPVTCEVTPHHLLLSSEELRRIGPVAVTVPPVRELQTASSLWDGVRNGWIDMVGSDHAPHLLSEKSSDVVWQIKSGIPGLETTLPLLLTEVSRGRLSLGDLVRLTAENPAKAFGLNGKGSLKEGSDADLAIVDLKDEFRIDASGFHSKAKYSPFDGRNVKGRAVQTFVKGMLVMDKGEIVAKPGSGCVLRGRGV